MSSLSRSVTASLTGLQKGFRDINLTKSKAQGPTGRCSKRASPPPPTCLSIPSSSKWSFLSSLYPVAVSTSGPRTRPTPKLQQPQPRALSGGPTSSGPSPQGVDQSQGLEPELSALASGVYFPPSHLCVQRQAAFPLWASASSSVKWALLPAWPTPQKVAGLNLKVGV